MKTELSTKFEGLCLIARTPEEEAELDEVYKKGTLHFVCKAIIPKKGRRYKRLLLQPSLNKWSKNGMIAPQQRKKTP